MILTVVAAAVFWLAWSNGANDNFKGVATLYGSGAASYATALKWATAATLLGSIVSVALAHTLLQRFSGKGLIPEELITPAFLGAVAASSAATVMIATLAGMPTSTTHALTGSLVGAALTAGWSNISGSVLMTKFAQPLLLSPVLAIVLTAAIYSVLSWIRKRTGVEQRTSICIGNSALQPVSITNDGAAMLASGPEGLSLEIGDADRCVQRYAGRCVGVDSQTAVNSMHYLSAAAVCFARAVNDTPKIAALLLTSLALGGPALMGDNLGLLMVALAMAAGGWLHARKVAHTMSKRITDLNPGQGLTASLMTAVLVLGASRLGVPVSTTHVSCGSIFGIGLVNKTRNWSTISSILATWVTTLPVGMILGACFFLIAGYVGG